MMTRACQNYPQTIWFTKLYLHSLRWYWKAFDLISPFPHYIQFLKNLEKLSINKHFRPNIQSLFTAFRTLNYSRFGWSFLGKPFLGWPFSTGTIAIFSKNSKTTKAVELEHEMDQAWLAPNCSSFVNSQVAGKIIRLPVPVKPVKTGLEIVVPGLHTKRGPPTTVLSFPIRWFGFLKPNHGRWFDFWKPNHRFFGFWRPNHRWFGFLKAKIPVVWFLKTKLPVVWFFKNQTTGGLVYGFVPFCQYYFVECRMSVLTVVILEF